MARMAGSAKQGGSDTASAIVEDLVHRAASGDREAQEALLNRYRYFIRRAVRDRFGLPLRGREDTSDLEQDAALAVLNSLKGQKWRGRRAFVAWLRTIAAGEVIDRVRYHTAQRRNVAQALPLDEQRLHVAARTPESWLDEQRLIHELEKRLDTLPAHHAQALVLHHQGHTHEEIGAVLGVSAEAARKLVARARAKLTAS